MPTIQFGDRSLDCDRGTLLRDEFIDGRIDPDCGPGREGGGYGVSAVAFERAANGRLPGDHHGQSGGPSDGRGGDDRVRH